MLSTVGILEVSSEYETSTDEVTSRVEAVLVEGSEIVLEMSVVDIAHAVKLLEDESVVDVLNEVYMLVYANVTTELSKPVAISD